MESLNEENNHTVTEGENNSQAMTEELQQIQQQAAEVGMFIHSNIRNVCTAVLPFIPTLASEVQSYIYKPHGAVYMQSKKAKKCLGHRGLQLVKLVETLVRFVICEAGSTYKVAIETQAHEDGGNTSPNTSTLLDKSVSVNSETVIDHPALDIMNLLCSTNVLKYCWDLCFVYEYNSLLHLSVHRILLMVIDNDTIIKQ